MPGLREIVLTPLRLLLGRRGLGAREGRQNQKIPDIKPGKLRHDDKGKVARHILAALNLHLMLYFAW